MKRQLKNIFLITIITILLFGFENVFAKTCTNRLESKSCLPTCQYSGGSGKVLSILTYETEYEIEYKEVDKNPSRLDQDRGATYENVHSTGIYGYNTFFLKYAEVLNVDGHGEGNICTQNAYRVKKDGDKWFTCMDNDGTSCKNKYGSSILDTYTLDTELPSIEADGTVKINDEGGETREKNEEKALNALNEQRIILKEGEISDESDCSGLFGDVITNDINTALKYIKYLGPILIIVLSILDFIKAVASGENDAFNNAWKRLLTRLIVAILLFFVVDLVKLIFNIFDITVPDNCLK